MHAPVQKKVSVKLSDAIVLHQKLWLMEYAPVPMKVWHVEDDCISSILVSQRTSCGECAPAWWLVQIIRQCTSWTNLDSGQDEGGCRSALKTLPHNWSPSCRGPYPVQSSTCNMFAKKNCHNFGLQKRSTSFNWKLHSIFPPSSFEGQDPTLPSCQSFSSES